MLHLIHKVTGEFYGDFLQERIFRPLGMNATRIITEADIVPNRSAGYRLLKRELKNQEWVSPMLNSTADGSLYFSIMDLAKWDAALYTEKLLKRSSLEQMWTVAKKWGIVERLCLLLLIVATASLSIWCVRKKRWFVRFPIQLLLGLSLFALLFLVTLVSTLPGNIYSEPIYSPNGKMAARIVELI